MKYFEKGYLEIVTDILKGPAGLINWIPHHMVIHPTKKKPRVVFAANTPFEGTSQNDEVHRGPNLTGKLISVFLKFRQHPVAFLCDI